MIPGPFMSPEARYQGIEAGLRKLSDTQLRQRFRAAFKHNARKRLSREALIRAVLGTRVEPGIILTIEARPGPQVIDAVEGYLERFPDAPPGDVVAHVLEECPWSLINKRQIPWYKWKLRKAVLIPV